MTTSEHGADGGEPIPRAPRYTLKPVFTPVAPKGDGRKPAGRALGARAENEDDDGYDPYSDFHDGTAGEVPFERDPWR